MDAWLGVYAESTEELEKRCAELQKLMDATRGATTIGSQDAGQLKIDGQYTTKEHFGYTDGFGNPDYLGVERDTQPGQGKLTPDGKWAPLATGEVLLGVRGRGRRVAGRAGAASAGEQRHVHGLPETPPKCRNVSAVSE